MSPAETKRTTLIFLDVPVSVRDHIIVKEPHMNKICPLCRGEIKEGEKCKFIVNNYKLFPNIFVHEACFTQREPSEVIEWLHKDYQEYEHVMSIYKCWK